MHYRRSNLPAYQVLDCSKTIRKFPGKRYPNNDHEMLREECIEGILETKYNVINELKIITALQNN